MTVLVTLVLVAFSFALPYARSNIEHGGLRFCGPQPPVFSDYVYLAAGCSMTFGTTITTSAMRRVVTVHSALGWLRGTVVVAVLISRLVG